MWLTKLTMGTFNWMDRHTKAIKSAIAISKDKQTKDNNWCVIKKENWSTHYKNFFADRPSNNSLK